MKPGKQMGEILGRARGFQLGEQILMGGRRQDVLGQGVTYLI